MADTAEVIESLVDQALARDAVTSSWPRDADAGKRALLVHTTDALFAYYLAPDGTVFELDLDRAIGSLERVTDARRIHEVYAAAAARFPALASLAGVDSTRTPRTLDEALAYGGQVVAAWDLLRSADDIGSLRVFAVGLQGARPLHDQPVPSVERDDLLERLVAREIRIGSTWGSVVWIGDTELHVWTDTACALHAWFSNVRVGDVYAAASELSHVFASDTELRLVRKDRSDVAVSIPPEEMPVWLAEDVATWLELPCYREGQPVNVHALEVRRVTQALVETLVRLPREGSFADHSAAFVPRDGVVFELRLTADPAASRARTLELRARVDARSQARVLARGTTQALVHYLRRPRTATEVSRVAAALRDGLV